MRLITTLTVFKDVNKPEKRKSLLVLRCGMLSRFNYISPHFVGAAIKALDKLS